VPATHTWPVELAVQSTHAPLVPHWVFDVPATHAVPAQQAPLHGWVPLHVETHLCCVVSQAVATGQSLEALQPHAPLTHA
jgi:hypothetical protein